MATADHFSECVESHAFETYDKFIKTQGGKLEDSKVVCLSLASFQFAHVSFTSKQYIVYSDAKAHPSYFFWLISPFDLICSFGFFVDELKKKPAPEVAIKYYTGGDLYLFGEYFFLQCIVKYFKMSNAKRV